MININNNKPDPSQPIEGFSPFDFVPVEIQREILSFVNSDVNSESFVNVSEVCKVFNSHVNSGNIQGKNGREYFLNKLEKLNKIDFEYTKEDLYSLVEMNSNSENQTAFQNIDPNKLENFKENVLITLQNNLENISNKKIEKTKQSAIKNIKEFMSKDKEIKNKKLAELIAKPKSEESKEFFKSFAQKTLLNLIQNKTDEELKEMGLTLDDVFEDPNIQMGQLGMLFLDSRKDIIDN